MLRGHSGFILQSRLDRQTDGGILFGEYEPLAQSGLFDSDFYIKSNPDLATLNIDPLLHYLERGCRERRDPSARFDTGHYLKLCDALGEAPANPLTHYLTIGMRRGLTSAFIRAWSTPANGAPSARRPSRFAARWRARHVSWNGPKIARAVSPVCPTLPWPTCIRPAGRRSLVWGSRDRDVPRLRAVGAIGGFSTGSTTCGRTRTCGCRRAQGPGGDYGCAPTQRARGFSPDSRHDGGGRHHGWEAHDSVVFGGRGDADGIGGDARAVGRLVECISASISVWGSYQQG